MIFLHLNVSIYLIILFYSVLTEYFLYLDDSAIQRYREQEKSESARVEPEFNNFTINYDCSTVHCSRMSMQTSLYTQPLKRHSRHLMLQKNVDGDGDSACVIDIM